MYTSLALPGKKSLDTCRLSLPLLTKNRRPPPLQRLLFLSLYYFPLILTARRPQTIKQDFNIIRRCIRRAQPIHQHSSRKRTEGTDVLKKFLETQERRRRLKHTKKSSSFSSWVQINKDSQAKDLEHVCKILFEFLGYMSDMEDWHPDTPLIDLCMNNPDN
ncbi:hypothetical protein OIU79_013233 [Salix purpurea]|uniref:Uncharacterized protein n=1 Tax=Salix purpurea TaxID=77065 RepID=A0A9Q0Q5R0_SALPP|nr:hypothetical protein OIU79_013233 [Salix purpurea]